LRRAAGFGDDLARGFEPAAFFRADAGRFVEDFLIAGFFAVDVLIAGPRRAVADFFGALLLRDDFFAPRLAPADRAPDFFPALLPPARPDFLAPVAICRSLRVSHRVEQPGFDVTAERRGP
jgi:hypothetical protein